MSDSIIELGQYNDTKLGKFSAANLRQDKRGMDCSYKCSKCNETILDTLHEMGDVYKFIYCKKCKQKHVMMSFRKYDRGGSLDEVIVSTAIIKWWLSIAQPEKDFVNVRDTPEFIRLVYNENRSSDVVYQELRTLIANKRNSKLLSLFKKNETIIKLR